MFFAEYLSQALDSLAKNRMRALLTMSGIVVGVFTVVLTIEIGAGARRAVENQIAALGSNLIVVNSGPPPGSGQQAVYLYPSDAKAIASECPLVQKVSPQQETRFPVTYKSAQLQSNFVMGVTASYAEVRRVELAAGRFITNEDDLNATKVVVLGASVQQYLFGAEPAQGRRLLINGIDFEVIGVLQVRGDSPGLGPGMSSDDRVFIPLSSLQKRITGTTELRLIAIMTKNPGDMDQASTQIRAILNRRHINNPFEIKTQLELMQTSDSVSAIVNLLLTSLAAVSLLVGGIGIMNIMLVAVTERTREIGVRRAIGARRSSILFQFLTESVILSLTGGIAGVVAGVGVSLLAGYSLHWEVPVVPKGIAVAILVATLVGIASGIYPARRASKLKVVDALRFE